MKILNILRASNTVQCNVDPWVKKEKREKYSAIRSYLLPLLLQNSIDIQ